MIHVPVLLKETIEILNPQSGEFFIDGTLGSGGHAVEILEKIGPEGKLLGIDWDNEAIQRFKLKTKNLKLKAIVVHGNYADLPEILKQRKLGKADRLILDLGFSSEHLQSDRGFSFLKNEPLDMRYNTESISINQFNNQYKSAAVIVNNYSEKELAEIFWKYGEERFSRQIARKIIEERKIKPIKTTFDLVETIQKVIPFRYGRLHPATRVFQALRIYVNKELENLEKLLKNLSKIVKGRVAIISYHSLEDRLVKNCFRDLKKQGKAQILTKKPIRPSQKEIIDNPRSRSAKLRAIVLAD